MHRITWTLILLLLTTTGTLWFWQIERWSLLDSLYMTVITLSTVGFHEVRPLSPRGRVFLIVFLVTGLGVFLFSIVQIGELIVRAEMGNWRRRRSMYSALKSLEGHCIVCGFGRMGRRICQHLAERKSSFVAIDRSETLVAECEERGWPYVCDDATRDETLRDAGVAHARGLAAVLNDDADNLFVVLSARLLVPKLQIIAREMDETSARKMEKAGANRVVSLYATGAATMAQLLVNPQVEDFFELVPARGIGLDLAEIRVNGESPYVDKSLAETDFRDRGVIIVAIRRPNGEVLLPPPASTIIRRDDELIALGKGAAISQFLKEG
jgi:voltage-gated potassium channel